MSEVNGIVSNVEKDNVADTSSSSSQSNTVLDEAHSVKNSQPDSNADAEDADVAEAPKTYDIEAQSALDEGYVDDFERADSIAESSRQLSRALTNAGSAAEVNATYKTPLPPMGLGKEIPTSYPDAEPYTVSFNGPDDPIHPHNWPLKKKLFTCVCIAFNTAAIAWGSSVFSSALVEVAERFHISTVVASLGISLYVLGFATGPVIWAPLSELYGRKPVMLVSCFCFTIFQFGVATAENIQTVMLCRAFGGTIGAAPLVVVPAAFADMFNNNTRGKAITIFSITVFMIPVVAPVAGSFIEYSYLGWRWTEYITGIMGGFGLILIVLFYDETHHPIILVNKAKEIKKRTGNWLIHAPHDEFELSLQDIVQKNITRPIRMLFTEPIILLISIYNAFIYGILYMLLSAYPIVFAEGYGIKGGVAELPYLGLSIGMVAGGGWCYYCEGAYLLAMKENDGKPVPEKRLLPLFAGCIVFPIGLLWFTWTGNYHKTVHWMAPTAAGIFIGFGLITIFNASINYIIDSYLIFAASALAGNTFLRSAMACAFPLFSSQMFHNMGVNWAGLMLGLIGIVLIPVPFLFYKFGKRIRTKSKFAFVLS